LEKFHLLRIFLQFTSVFYAVLFSARAILPQLRVSKKQDILSESHRLGHSSFRNQKQF